MEPEYVSSLRAVALLLFCALYTLGLFWWPQATAGGLFAACGAGLLLDSRRRGMGWVESLLRATLLSLCAAALPPLLLFGALYSFFCHHHRCRRQAAQQ